METVWVEGQFKSVVQPVKVVEQTDTSKEVQTTSELGYNELEDAPKNNIEK